ncbi:MAG: FAD-dependent oxidoreductase [Candidatus Berkiella sp.]
MSDDFLLRRRLIKGIGIAGLSALAWPLVKYIYPQQHPAITQAGTTPALAHQIRDPHFPPISQHERTQVAIIGSGVAGLSAARQLQLKGLTDFRVLELETMIGGNAASGHNSISAYPWGAHYLPVPGSDSDFLYPFLQEANVITGFNEQGNPYYNELFLCHDLHERLYLNGSWQEGLVPLQGISAKDKEEITQFFALMTRFKHTKGQDDRYAFTIPVEASSSDPTFVRFDQITMAEYLNELGLYSPYLRWYVNYCCRDDFGGGIDKVSAWAGIHYFASRRACLANDMDDAILVWPQGNGFLVDHLAQPFMDRIQTQSLVYQVVPHANQMAVHYFDAKTQTSVELLAEQVIMAIPRFVAHKICHPDFQDAFQDIQKLDYAPWLVANISLKALPVSKGADLAWDNVSYYSRSLGYIHANHQSLSGHRGESVITYYLPLDHLPPREARQQALARTTQEWHQLIVNDLETMHEDIRSLIQDIQIRVLGHGMICPTPHMISSTVKQIKRSQGRLFFAHSDMSGLSLFEEAYWQGLQTANRLLASV